VQESREYDPIVLVGLELEGLLMGGYSQSVARSGHWSFAPPDAQPCSQLDAQAFEFDLDYCNCNCCDPDGLPSQRDEADKKCERSEGDKRKEKRKEKRKGEAERPSTAYVALPTLTWRIYVANSTTTILLLLLLLYYYVIVSEFTCNLSVTCFHF